MADKIIHDDFADEHNSFYAETQAHDSVEYSEYAEHFSDDAFWEKLKGILKKAGRELLEAALKLYYATRDPETPGWVKAVAIGALGYLILPIDVIPDILPMVGLSDDLAVLVGAVSAVSAHIKEAHIAQAREKLNEWFGE
jgi:uncharacterized membrane protein YkvA (DUF1232 family)